MREINEIITDEQINLVHGHANFGTIENRRVVDCGVIQSALGWHVGSTLFHILREHKLITVKQNLTKLGKEYARALYAADKFNLE